ncbi:MAG: hypothetical protein HC836_35900 [Richelia sp. RM2_1_2]|nr:hypothetical protein [Richelia sp. RM2_1_2]
MKTEHLNENLLESQVALLKKALEYYSSENNYTSGSIEKDNGHIAKHTLTLVKNINDQIVEAKESYENTIQKIGENYFAQLDDTKSLTVEEMESLKKLDKISEIINNKSDS